MARTSRSYTQEEHFNASFERALEGELVDHAAFRAWLIADQLTFLDIYYGRSGPSQRFAIRAALRAYLTRFNPRPPVDPMAPLPPFPVKGFTHQPESEEWTPFDAINFL